VQAHYPVLHPSSNSERLLSKPGVMASVAAFYSPFSGSMSDIAIYRQLRTGTAKLATIPNHVAQSSHSRASPKFDCGIAFRSVHLDGAHDITGASQTDSISHHFLAGYARSLYNVLDCFNRRDLPFARLLPSGAVGFSADCGVRVCDYLVDDSLRDSVLRLCWPLFWKRVAQLRRVHYVCCADLRAHRMATCTGRKVPLTPRGPAKA
jgi:hypothetical protein